MKLIEKFKGNKSILLTLTLLVALAFIYGCECSGSIGSSLEKTQTINTQSESK